MIWLLAGAGWLFAGLIPVAAVVGAITYAAAAVSGGVGFLFVTLLLMFTARDICRAPASNQIITRQLRDGGSETFLGSA